MRKFYQESVLVEQAFVMDPDTTVGKFIEKHAAELKAPVKLKGFVKFEVGEGIEKAAIGLCCGSGGVFGRPRTETKPLQRLGIRG